MEVLLVKSYTDLDVFTQVHFMAVHAHASPRVDLSVSIQVHEYPVCAYL